jgi:hypothetical protein
MAHPFGGRTVSALAQQVTSKSAVNPCLWACLVISVPLFSISAFVDGIKFALFFGIALIPVAVYVFSYIYLLIYNPKYLRSEEYQLKAQAIELLGDRDNPLSADAADVVSIIGITNPTLPALPPPGKEHE